MRSRFALLAGGWAGAAALVLVLPGNLIMRLAFGKLDDPVLGRQLLSLGLGLLLGLATLRYGLRTASGAPRRRPDGTAHPALWARVVTWVAAGVPVLGFSVPHLLWGLGIPFGVAAGADVTELGGSAVFWALLVAGPVAGAVLTLGLISRWGQVLPGWLPGAGGRPVPRVLAVVPAAGVGLLVGQYGTMMTTCLAVGFTRTCAPDGGTEVLDGSWGFAGTYPVFLLWGVFLLAATVGYLHNRGPHGQVRATNHKTGGRGGQRASDGTVVRFTPVLDRKRLNRSNSAGGHSDANEF